MALKKASGIGERGALLLAAYAVATHVLLKVVHPYVFFSGPVWGGFHWAAPIVWILAPALLCRRILGLGWRQLGFARPRLTPRLRALIMGGAVLALVVVPWVRLDSDYVEYYRNFLTGVFTPRWERFARFGAYTASTLIGWELFHRGFLLFGLRRFLLSDARAIAYVATVEVLVHLDKPGWEAAGMLVASPFLSGLAIATGSLWPSLLLHLWIEGLFAAAMIF